MWIPDECYLELECPVEYGHVPPGPKVLAKHKNEVFYKVGYVINPNDKDLLSHLPKHLVDKLASATKIHFKYFGNTVYLEAVAYKKTSIQKMLSITELSTQWGAKLKPNKKNVHRHSK